MRVGNLNPLWLNHRMHPRTRELLEYLDEQRAVLRAAVDSVPAALREKPPASGRWSVAEIIDRRSAESRPRAGNEHRSDPAHDGR
jgi:hypothetical protein